jgi:hemerythrin-like domain-containing protein
VHCPLFTALLAAALCLLQFSMEAQIPRLKSGSVQEVFAMEFTQLLAAEHQAIRRALNVLESMRDKMQHGYSVDIHDVNALLLFLHCFADGCHQGKEESILFPALKQSLQNPNRGDSRFLTLDLESLLGEHKQERDLIQKTQTALFARQGSDFADQSRRLIDLLVEHIVQEERILLPMAEQILTPQEAIAAGMQMQEANASFGECQVTLLLDMLKRLEDKFLSKAA